MKLDALAKQIQAGRAKRTRAETLIFRHDLGPESLGKHPAGSRVAWHGPGSDSCYACDAKPIGFRDRRPEGSTLALACRRHADPRIKVSSLCSYCDGPRPTLDVDGNYAHARCERDASR
jgi:hypothetical protein